MSELFKKVQMTPIEAPKSTPEFLESVKAEIKKQLDQRLLDQSKEIGLRETLRRQELLKRL